MNNKLSGLCKLRGILPTTSSSQGTDIRRRDREISPPNGGHDLRIRIGAVDDARLAKSKAIKNGINAIVTSITEENISFLEKFLTDKKSSIFGREKEYVANSEKRSVVLTKMAARLDETVNVRPTLKGFKQDMFDATLAGIKNLSLVHRKKPFEMLINHLSIDDANLFKTTLSELCEMIKNGDINKNPEIKDELAIKLIEKMRDIKFSNGREDISIKYFGQFLEFLKKPENLEKYFLPQQPSEAGSSNQGT